MRVAHRALPIWKSPTQPLLQTHATKFSLVGIFMLFWLSLTSFSLQAAGIISTADLGPGLTYTNIRSSNISMHVLIMNRSQKDLELVTTLGRGTFQGISTVSEQSKSISPTQGKAIAAINGGLYMIRRGPCQGDPIGLLIRGGDFVSDSKGSPAFWIDINGNPQAQMTRSSLKMRCPDGTSVPFTLNEAVKTNGIVLFTPTFGPSTGTKNVMEWLLAPRKGSSIPPLLANETYSVRIMEVREEGDAPIPEGKMVLSAGQAALPMLKSLTNGAAVTLSISTGPQFTGVKTAIAIDPTLVHEGKGWDPKSKGDRNPRTAIGWNKASLFLVAVDGRQPRLSVGMTFAELSAAMMELGCEEAVNLDGGGSTTFWLDGKVMNSPSDGRERPVADAVVIIRKLIAERTE